MRRRFSRRRRTESGDEGRSPLNAREWLDRISGAGLAQDALEVRTVDGVPEWYAVVGQTAAGQTPAQLVGFSPSSGGDALFAVLAAANEDAQAPFAGEIVALAPSWSAAALRKIAMLRSDGVRVRALAASGLADGVREIERDGVGPLAGVTSEQVAGHLANPVDRALFARAASALEGLADKHGGSIRGRGRQLELVIMARRSAVLHARDHGVFLETILPQRSETRLDDEELAGALDRLEGHLRKRLNDRHVRDGEEGLRAKTLRLIAGSRALRSLRAWPIGSADPDPIDGVAVDAEGRPVAVAVRTAFDLVQLGPVVDALTLARPVLPALLGGASPPVRFDALRLIVAGESVSAAARRVLSALDLGSEIFEIQQTSRGVSITSAGEGVPVSGLGRKAASPRDESPPSTAKPRARADAASSSPDSRRAELEAESDEGAAAPERADTRDDERGGRGRSRRRSRRGRGRSDAATSDANANADDSERAEQPRGRMESVSFFDLDDGRDEGRAGPSDERPRGDDSGEEGDTRRRRGGRGRRRGRRGGSERNADLSTREEAEPEGAAPPGGGGQRSRSGGRERLSGRDLDGRSDTARDPSRDESLRSSRHSSDSEGDDEDDHDVDVDDALSPMVSDLPDFDEVQVGGYDEDDDGESDGDDVEWRTQREKRRLARRGAARAQTEAPAAEPEEAPRVARKRSALLVHADRESVLAGILLARDLRQIEGFWVYPQEDLMTFFRSVAPDLRDDTPIHVIGFTPSPAFDVLQTVNLYRQRLAWYDHRNWAPEDAGALRNMLGELNLALTPATGSVLPAVLSACTRRSRFSDKLVDLATGRFTQHDYERWGRLWWSKLERIAGMRGDRRPDIDALLVGRPSELARDAARLPTPPPPAEVEAVASIDHRVVYFAGYSMVVVEVGPRHDPYLLGRIARERYAATLSLAYRREDGLVVLASDEQNAKRSLDTGAVAEHLSQKISGVEVLADDDHVSRLHVEGLGESTAQLDSLIAEIAMGRSILEG